MNVDLENFVINLTDSTKTHNEWLNVMRFGMQTLLKNPLLLIECVVREAEKQHKKSTLPNRVIADEARVIMDELNLCFEVSSSIN